MAFTRERQSRSPLWLEFSGLPAHLAAEIRGGAGWPVFKKIVELDLEANPRRPGTVEVTLAALAERCGLETTALRKTLTALRKLRLLAVFLPDGDEEAALFKVQSPLKTPRTAQQISETRPDLFPSSEGWRYTVPEEEALEALAAGGQERPADPLLQEIIDLYFNTVSLKMNAFILDELGLLRQRFAMEDIRRNFRRAQQNEIRSLSWVVRELVAQKKKRAEATAAAEALEAALRTQSFDVLSALQAAAAAAIAAGVAAPISPTDRRAEAGFDDREAGDDRTR